MSKIPERIEVFDNSHISGTNAVGAMIVSGTDGFMKNAYRKFNIRNVGKKKKRRIDNKNIKAVNKFFVFMFVFLKFIFESNIIEALIVKIIKKSYDCVKLLLFLRRPQVISQIIIQLP